MIYPNSENHYVHRNNWLRAAVLGANDGIISTTSLVIGVAAASSTREEIIIAAVASLVAGAGSMAAGEYVSVSSQADTEKADLQRESAELENQPEEELDELTDIYIRRGLTKDLARDVAMQLMAHNALDAHAKEELGINDISKAKPLQAAGASAASFISGGFMPCLVAWLAPVEHMIYCQYIFAIVFLAISGAIAAKFGGANILKSVLRICFWGTVAMAISAFVGSLFGVQAG